MLKKNYEKNKEYFDFLKRTQPDVLPNIIAELYPEEFVKYKKMLLIYLKKKDFKFPFISELEFEDYIKSRKIDSSAMYNWKTFSDKEVKNFIKFNKLLAEPFLKHSQLIQKDHELFRLLGQKAPYVLLRTNLWNEYFYITSRKSISNILNQVSDKINHSNIFKILINDGKLTENEERYTLEEQIDFSQMGFLHLLVTHIHQKIESNRKNITDINGSRSFSMDHLIETACAILKESDVKISKEELELILIPGSPFFELGDFTEIRWSGHKGRFVNRDCYSEYYIMDLVTGFLDMVSEYENTLDLYNRYNFLLKSKSLPKDIKEWRLICYMNFYNLYIANLHKIDFSYAHTLGKESKLTGKVHKILTDEAIDLIKKFCENKQEFRELSFFVKLKDLGEEGKLTPIRFDRRKDLGIGFMNNVSKIIDLKKLLD